MYLYVHGVLLLQITLHWYKDEVQISRNNEIINQDVTTIYDLEMLKYTVTVDNGPASGKLNYSLVLHRFVYLTITPSCFYNQDTSI
jgi:hypothetical protein